MNAKVTLMRGAGLLALLILSVAARGSDAPPQKTFVVGHRGLLLDAPENTLANFRACLQLRLGFELDVRRSKDGQLVCIHDESVDRTTNGKGLVAGLTLKELQALDAGSWFGPRFAGERIPTLDEVLKLIAEHRDVDAVVAIDLKISDPQVEADLVRLAKQHVVLDRLVVIGRAIEVPEVRHRLKQADGLTHVACLAATPEQLDAAVADPDADWVYIRFVPTRAQVEKVHEDGKWIFLSGPKVAGREGENWRRGAVRGVDAILTDYATDLARQMRDDRRRMDDLKASLAQYFAPPAEFKGDFGKYGSPLKATDGTLVQTAADWSRRREAVLQDWRQMLGGWPDQPQMPLMKVVGAAERTENVTRYRVQVEVFPDKTPAEGHLLIPDGKGPFPAAVVPFYDSATSVGLAERGAGSHDYGLQLARRGFVTLSIGTPGSLDNPAPITRELLTDAGERLERQPLLLLSVAAANCHAILAQRPDVDPERIGIIGLSYGGKWSMFASCLYERFAAAVWSDPGIVFDELDPSINYWEPWYLGYEKGVRRPQGVPNDERPRTGLYKRLIEANRDLNELHPLICPRPVLVSGGTQDPPRNWRALNHLVEVNRLLGFENRVALTSRKPHVPTPEALELELRFLEWFLKYQ